MSVIKALVNVGLVKQTLLKKKIQVLAEKRLAREIIYFSTIAVSTV